jgi:hypothetical protein
LKPEKIIGLTDINGELLQRVHWNRKAAFNFEQLNEACDSPNKIFQLFQRKQR